MLTSVSDDDALLGAVMAGAAGYVLTDILGGDLVGAVRTVAAGGSLLDAQSTAHVSVCRTLGSPADAARVACRATPPDAGEGRHRTGAAWRPGARALITVNTSPRSEDLP